MTLPKSYKSGTITVPAGGTQVTGTGTNWTGFGVRAGDILWAGGIDVAVASVEGRTALTLAFPWSGPALTAAPYEIRLTPDANRVLAASREAIQSIEDFRGDVYASANVYSTVANGLAAVKAGEQFQVLAGAEIIRYRREANGTATELARYATAAQVQSEADRAAAAAATATTAVSAEVVARQRGIRDAGVLPLANVGGTANAITATRTAAMIADGIIIGGSALVDLIPVATNTGEVTLSIDGGPAEPVQRRSGTPLRAGDIISAASILLRRRGAAWRLVGLVESEVDTRIEAGLDPLSDPFATTAGDAWRALRTDSNGNVIERWREAGGGLDFYAAPEFWDRAPAPAGLAPLSQPYTTKAATEGHVLRVDGVGNAIEIMRPDGLDGFYSAQFWARGAAALQALGFGGGSTTPAPTLSTTLVDIIATDGQSLTVSGDFTPAVSLAYLRTLRSPAALMLTGMRRGDGVALTDVAGPRSQAYDTATPSTGLAQAEPPAGAIALAFPVAAALNLHRADLGLPQVPVVTTSHGISGIPIEDMDADPATEAGTTTVWGNLTYWTAEAKRVIEAAGKTARQPWHVWTHGTSAKAKARGDYAARWWALRDATVAQWRAQGVPVPRYIMTQSGGDANTVGDSWAVCDDQLDICEAGGAVLATPLYWCEIADNNVHPDAEGVTLFGETYAWAMAEVEAGRRWTITRPKLLWDVSASVLILDFDSLREDEWLEAEDAAKYATSGGVGLGADALGFEATGAAITSLTLRGRTVRLTCSAKPTQLRYAMQVQDMTGAAGNRFNAHRGLLRTSTREPSKLLPGRTLVRAVPSFTLSIPA